MSDNTKSHKHDIPAMSGKGDNTKSADPLPWVNGHGERKPDDGTSFGRRNDMARWSCSLCIRHYAPRPEFGFTEGNDTAQTPGVPDAE